MVMSERERQQIPARIWPIAIAGSTSISLADVLVSRFYGSGRLVDGALATAGLLAIQLGALAVLLSIAGLIRVSFSRRSLENQGFAVFTLLLVVCALLANLAFLDYANSAYFDSTNVFAAKSAIALLAISAITLFVAVIHRGWARIHFILKNEHFVLAMPFAIAVTLVVFSRTELAIAEVRWHRPVAIAISAVLVLVAFIPCRRRWPGIGKSVAITAGCFGVVLAPVAGHWSRVHDSWRAQAPAGAPQHVLLVTVDTLRSDALSCLGATDHRTPAIDEFAAQSVVFTRAVSPSSWTTPAVASILTGLSPLTHQVDLHGVLDKRCTTIAEVFASYGYLTGATSNNPLLRSGSHNFEQGFHHYTVFPRREFERPSYGVCLTRRLFPQMWPAQVTTAGLTDQAIRWYRRQNDGRTFLWLHYMDPHMPYAPPATYLDAETIKTSAPVVFDPTIEVRTKIRQGNVPDPERIRQIRNLYLAEVRYVDAEIGRLMEFLNGSGLLDDMMVVFASDHGEELWDHGRFEHGHTMYSEILNVPFMIKLPRQTRQAIVESPVSIVDILPTTADLCSLSVDKGVWDGRSLRSYWESDSVKPTDVPLISAFTMYLGDQRAVIFQDFKLIHNLMYGSNELYALAKDPGERHNISQEEPETVLQLAHILEEAEETAVATRERLGLTTSTEAHPEETVEILKTLGYI
jgi:arylsulfatase A-like enzyme